MLGLRFWSRLQSTVQVQIPDEVIGELENQANIACYLKANLKLH